jgi:hypothetical protein
MLRIFFALITTQLLAIIDLTLAGGVLLLRVCWKMFRELRSHGQLLGEESHLLIRGFLHPNHLPNDKLVPNLTNSSTLLKARTRPREIGGLSPVICCFRINLANAVALETGRGAGCGQVSSRNIRFGQSPGSGNLVR